VYVPGKNMLTEPKKFAKASFKYDEEKDIYLCPNDKPLSRRGKYLHSQKKIPMTIYSAGLSDCRACLNRQACCKNQKKRTIHALPEDCLFHRIKKKLGTIKGKAIYNLRKQTVERSIGDIKYNKNFRGFLLRGLKKVKIELNLACIAHNLVLINNRLTKTIVPAASC